MKIRFQDNNTSQQIQDAIESLMQLLGDQYQLRQFQNVELNFTLLNDEGEEVTLINQYTAEPLERIEIRQLDLIDTMMPTEPAAPTAASPEIYSPPSAPANFFECSKEAYFVPGTNTIQ